MEIRANMYCLFKNYLMYRTQYVHYNGCSSSTKPIEYGVSKCWCYALCLLDK